ncbi:DNA polymerase III subunit delta' [Hyphococcus sp.]|uniref:DNA polymerase III subunit delta' n=1 Tax=Hyphococcus sp. TaxID=2038636 RepID=UPI0020863110|nr:MAG: DNA polymerase III subunit delta' [Marinicaulis sp.]
MDDELVSPRDRARQVGRDGLERSLRETINDGALTHGWIIAGPPGAGKATLAYRMARALLDPNTLENNETLDMPEDSRTFRLIAGEAHPDLFVAERLWDEKKGKHQSEINVETIRKLTAFLNRTASGGGARVAIVDTADDMNRNAANALLKALEEPPKGATLLLLSSAPGRLLPTVRSRCRRIDLAPVDSTTIEQLLANEGVGAGDASKIAKHARGRPGYALMLAAGEGAEAISLAHQFLNAAQSGASLSKVITGVTGKAGEARWPVFRDTIIAQLSDAARSTALQDGADGFEGVEAGALLDGWQAVSQLCGRGEALNLDRAQLIEAMAFDLRNALRGRVA